jgi:hypothetical protein
MNLHMYLCNLPTPIFRQILRGNAAFLPQLLATKFYLTCCMAAGVFKCLQFPGRPFKPN